MINLDKLETLAREIENHALTILLPPSQYEDSWHVRDEYDTAVARCYEICNNGKGDVARQLAAYIEAANPTVVLGLIAEVRKARAERDWLAGTLEKTGATLYELGLQCGKMYHTPRTKDEWVEISNDVVEAQNNDH